MKRMILFACLMLAALSGQADNELLYGSYSGSGTLTAYGDQKAETYDVAFFVGDSTLVGMEIRGLRIPINIKATGATDYQAWLSSELQLEGSKNVADIASVAFTPDGDWADVTFETPYVLTEKGVFVGYSLTIPQVDISNKTDPHKTPLMGLAGTANAGWFVHTSRTFRKWTALEGASTYSDMIPAMSVRLGGELVREYAASLYAAPELEAFALAGRTKALNFTLINHGTQDINSVGYELLYGTDTYRETLNLSPTLKGTYYGKQTSLKITLPAQQTPGSYPVTIRITEVNGQPNGEADSSVRLDMSVIKEMPRHKPLMEEYTGCWCQYCPRGMAAMDALNDIYGDNFIGVAYHNGDNMDVITPTPNRPSGYPHAFIDRVVDTDPFFGTSGASLGIQSDWKKRAALSTVAAIELQARWTDSELTAVGVSAEVSFICNFQDNPYRLSYILLADDLTGSGRGWSQVNAYSGQSTNDTYLKEWAQRPSTVVGLHFNDVAIQTSCSGAATLEESLPASVKGGEPYEHHYVFSTADNDLVQNPTKLRVVAVLVDTRTGEVVNAEQTSVEMPLGLRPTVQGTASRTFTDLSGRPLVQPRKGIFLQTEMGTDGKRRSTKVCR